MVSFKSLFLAAAAAVAVAAQDPSTDPVAAAAYWAAAADPSTVATEFDKRDFVGRLAERQNMIDPYAGECCYAPFAEPPCETTCNRNNCFRGFLNARSGSSGKHCPSEAFRFCCIWNSCPFAFFKAYGVESGLAAQCAPWLSSCQDKSDTTADVVAKIDDACGCTLNHEVTDNSTSAYSALIGYPAFSPQCH